MARRFDRENDGHFPDEPRTRGRMRTTVRPRVHEKFAANN